MVSSSQNSTVCDNMAAPGRQVGHYIQKNSRFLLNNLEQLRGHRGFGWTPAPRQQVAEASKDTIVIPRKKTWNKEAVLEALASTVSRDPTAYPYQFQDDPFLSPRTAVEFKLYSLSQEAGRSAAKYIVKTNPKLFTTDFAEPHIPCLMPETVSLRLEEVSEEALKERINLRKVTAAVDMYDQLVQTGTTVSMETTQDLLDLISLYCDKDPVQDNEPQKEETEESGEEVKKNVRFRQASKTFKSTWKENNNAERIFNLLPERDTRCYSALIRGMVMHGAHAKAFSMYTDMQNNRINGDIHIFNALIIAAPDVREIYNERWELMKELLNHMKQQKVKPNLQTFNNLLKALRRCGPFAKANARHTLNEMRALGIAPSLATYNHILAIFYRSASIGHANTDILQEIMSELAGTSFTCRDPDDDRFFLTAMKVCLENKDLELAYKVQSLLEVDANWRLLGDPVKESIYYARFFSLLCMREHIDVVMKWYKQLVPSLHYPTVQGMKDLLQALDTDNRLDLLPTIWKEICSLGHDNKIDLVEELLMLMARDTHSPEVQESFAECALNVTSAFREDRGKSKLQWTASSISHITSLLLRANKTQQAWDMLELCKSVNRVPDERLLEDFLTLCHRNGSPQRAVDLVQLSAGFCLSATPRLATRALAEFDLTEEQRAALSDLESAAQPSD